VRGDYLLAIVHSKLGQPDQALEHYDRAMARAEELADDFKEEWLKDWFIETRVEVEWK
jgi:hypothetical protein